MSLISSTVCCSNRAWTFQAPLTRSFSLPSASLPDHPGEQKNDAPVTETKFIPAQAEAKSSSSTQEKMQRRPHPNLISASHLKVLT